MKNCSQVKNGFFLTKKKKRNKKRKILGRHLTQKETREKERLMIVDLSRAVLAAPFSSSHYTVCSCVFRAFLASLCV